MPSSHLKTFITWKIQINFSNAIKSKSVDQCCVVLHFWRFFKCELSLILPISRSFGFSSAHFFQIQKPLGLTQKHGPVLHTLYKLPNLEYRFKVSQQIKIGECIDT